MGALEPSKLLDQYYPGLAQECRKAYRLTIDAIRDAAAGCGYAIAVHGSLSRDIDLIAVPWIDTACAAKDLAEAVRCAVESSHPDHLAFFSPADANPAPKPHGRLCWSIHMAHGPYIDLSVLPRAC